MSGEVIELERPVDKLPEGWKVQPLSKLCGEVIERVDPAAMNGDLGGHYIGLEHIGQGTGQLEDIGNAADVVSQKSRFHAGDVLYGKLRPNLRKVARPNFDGLCSTDIIVLRSKPSADPAFLFQVLQSEPLVAHAIATAAGTKMPRTHARSILSFEIAAPPLDEQRQIAEVLRSVDEAIAANQTTIQQSECALSALSDEVFAARTSEDASRWQQHPLEDMLDDIIDYRGVPPPKAADGIPLLTAKNVRFGYLDYEPQEFIAAKDYDTWMRRGLPKAGDILFTTEAPLGNVAEFPDIKAALGQRTLTLVPKPGVLDAKFLKWLLLSRPAQDLIWSHATGSTAKGIKQRTFRKLKFHFPTFDEQVRIAALLEDIGTARDETKRCSEVYVTMKGHLMSDLLSGRVRVSAPAAVATKSVPPAFKRAVFAAEIVHQLHNDNRFGSVKHEKIVHLCELHFGLQDDLDRHAYKEAAGPYDPKARRSVERIFQQQKWFDVTKVDGKRVVYVPLEKVGGHAEYFDRYFGDQKIAIQSIIDLLRPLNTERCEIVATLYAVWNDFLIDKQQPTDHEIIASVFQWHPKKQEIPEERWRAALPWMREKGLVPKGIGEKTRTVQG